MKKDIGTLGLLRSFEYSPKLIGGRDKEIYAVGGDLICESSQTVNGRTLS